jgi:hypothetical protein
MSTTTVMNILDSYITVNIKTYINIIYNDTLWVYVLELIRRIKISLKEMFRLLIEYETQVREIVKYLTIENAEWENKFDDFPIIG